MQDGAAWQSQGTDGRDRDAIVALVGAMAESWTRGDGAAYGRLFSTDSDYVAFDGTRLKSRDENVRHHRALFETVLKGSRAGCRDIVRVPIEGALGAGTVSRRCGDR
jgi:uncharacterized protein (TIGR02246 family)